MNNDIRNGDLADAVEAIGALELPTQTVGLAPETAAPAVPLSLRATPRRVLVTGATRGAGPAIAQALAGAGWHVTLAGRSRPALEEVRVTLPITEGVVHDCVELDVTDAASVVRAFAEVHARGGALQALVNNASATEGGPLARLPHDAWNRVLAVNLTGTFLCTQAALGPMLAARAGRIVNVTGTGATRSGADAGAGALEAARHGVLGLTRTLAREVASQGLGVNAVCHGYDAPADVAAIVLWLCDAAPAGFTGQAMSVDSGEL